MRLTVALFPLLGYASFLLTVCKAFGAENVTTLFVVQPNGTPTPTLPSGYSVEDDGTTVFTPEASGVYVAEVLHSRIVVHGPSTTLTLLSTLEKTHFTFSEDASSLRIDMRPGIGVDADVGPLECVLDREASTGRCAGVVEGTSFSLDSNGKITVGPTYTHTTTFSGNLLPIATVAVSSAGISGGKIAPDRLSSLAKSIGPFLEWNVLGDWHTLHTKMDKNKSGWNEPTHLNGQEY